MTPSSSVFPGFAPFALWWLGVLFASEQCGIFAHEANALLALGCFVLAWTVSALRPRAIESKSCALVGYALLGGGLLLLFAPVEMRMVGCAVSTAGWSRVARSRARDVRALEGLALGLFAFALCLLAFRAMPAAWHSLQAVSEWLCRMVLVVFGDGVVLSATYSGLLQALLGGLLLLGMASRCGHGLKVLFLGLLSVAFLLVIFVELFALMPHLAHGGVPGAAWVRSHLLPSHFGVVLGGFLLIPLAWSLHIKTNPALEGPRSSGMRFRWAAPACAVLVPLFLWNSPRASKDGASVALYRKGFVNYMAPSPHQYGRGSGGMLGLLPDFVRSRGLSCDFVDDISAKALEGKSVLVIINQDHALSDESKQAVDDFVRRGNSLLVVGDHTFHHGGAMFLNEPLAATAMRFRFDNAEFFVGGWLHSYQFFRHQVTSGIDDRENIPSSVIGASVEVAYPAVPLLVGRYGFSDPGVATASENGYMGNRIYDPGERLGDVVLAAMEDVGEGRVVTLGDTSALSNGLLTSSWPFVARLVDWLASPGRAKVSWWREFSALLAMLLTVGLLVRPDEREGFLPLLVTLLAFLVALWVSDALFVEASRVRPFLAGSLGKDGPAPLLLIDHSNITHCDRGTDKGDGVSTLGMNLLREGYRVLQTDALDEALMERASVVFLIAPCDEIRNAEVDSYERYVNGGGRLVLSAGRESRAAAARLLERFGLDVGNLPLGANSLEVADAAFSPSSYDAWEVAGGVPLAKIWGHPVIVQKSFGKGEVVLVGDGHFLREKNIETEEGAILHNAEFLRHFARRLIQEK